MLLALLAGYVAVVLGSAWLVVRSSRGSTRPPVLGRLAIYVVALAEAAYMLRSPACVHLPGAAPEAAAVEKVLVGKDAAGRLYWLEGRSPTGFAFGPRWWFRVGHSVEGGIEFIPPVRFAMTNETAWDLVSSDGRRRPFPTSKKLYGARVPRWGDWRYALRSDATLLSWDNDCFRSLSPEKPQWECLAPLASANRIEAGAVLPGDHTLEVRLEYIPFRDSRGRTRNLTLIERDPAGQQVRSAALTLPEAPAGDTPGPYHLRLTPTGGGFALLEAWRRRGRAYWLSQDLQRIEIRADFSHEGWVSDELSLAISDDGQFFTTGSAIFRTTGERLRELDPPLFSCVWLGHTLHGIRRYPFFAFDALDHSHAFNHFIKAGKTRGDPRIADVAKRSEKYRQAVERSAWILGGIDEAGREDEIVEVEVP